MYELWFKEVDFEISSVLDLMKVTARHHNLKFSLDIFIALALHERGGKYCGIPFLFLLFSRICIELRTKC